MVSTRLHFPNRALAAVSICLSLLAAPNASAVIGTVDAIPAATLLLPYFEVDLDDPNSITTLLFLTNTDASPAVAHMTLWTDTGVPTFSFDVGLTGFDVFSLNLRDVFNGAELTTSLGQVDTSAAAPMLIAAHTGNALPSTTDCAGFDHGDNVARGYVTIDNMNTEGAGFPTETGYFVNGGAGKASNANVLMGDYIVVDSLNNFAQGDTMVHIEASASDARVSTNGNYTFYGALIGGTAADNREPLGTTWSTPYTDGGEDSETTQLVYWRDIREVGAVTACGVSPAWYPLEETQVVAFDDEENATDVGGNSTLSLACGRVTVNGISAAGGVESPFQTGWIYVNLNSPSMVAPFGNIAQSFVTVVRSRLGIFSTGHEATSLSSATTTP